MIGIRKKKKKRGGVMGNEWIWKRTKGVSDREGRDAHRKGRSEGRNDTCEEKKKSREVNEEVNEGGSERRERPAAEREEGAGGSWEGNKGVSHQEFHCRPSQHRMPVMCSATATTSR